MRRNILLTTAAIAGIAMLSGCNNNPSNQSNNTSADTSQPADNAAGNSGTNNSANSSAPPQQSASASDATVNGATGSNGAATPSAEAPVTTIGFVTNAAMGDMYEISASRIALERSQSDAVKQFAQDMIDAHSKTTTDLKGALPPNSVQSLPQNLDATHQSMIDDLKNASDRDFDSHYLAQQHDAHEQALALFRSYADSGDEAQVKQFAQATVPLIQRHLGMVASLTTSHTRVAANAHTHKKHSHAE